MLEEIDTTAATFLAPRWWLWRRVDSDRQPGEHAVRRASWAPRTISRWRFRRRLFPGF